MYNKKVNKYQYLFVLQGLYSGWEDLTYSEDKKEVVNDKKDYILNDPRAYRIIRRRVLREGGECTN